jgi:putative ABC transport system ATP-binding protein
VLRGVDLELDAGEIALLEGPSGSGKTTLLTVAAGLLTADEGSVHLAGDDLASMTHSSRRKHRATHVGFMFQRANLLEGLTALENVLLAADLADVATSVARTRAEELFESLDIAGLEDRLPNELSGGEEHRVALARAVVHRPTLLLADEPTGNLDTESGRAVMSLLDRLVKKHEVALLIASHDQRLRDLRARELRIEDGRVFEPEDGAR